MLDADNRMSAADLLEIVGTNQPGVADGAPLIERILFKGAPFAKQDRRGLTLKCEDLVSADLHSLMLDAIRSKRFTGLCSHVANESHTKYTKQAMLRTQKKKAMGMISGAPDWWFIWTTFGTLGAGVIELKRPGRLEGGLSANQALVRDWCKSCGIPWACHNSADKAFEQLIEWGAVR